MRNTHNPHDHHRSLVMDPSLYKYEIGNWATVGSYERNGI
jgi:hypothetical protein